MSYTLIAKSMHNGLQSAVGIPCPRERLRHEHHAKCCAADYRLCGALQKRRDWSGCSEMSAAKNGHARLEASNGFAENRAQLISAQGLRHEMAEAVP